MRFPRASGVLLHPTSLPGPHGSGDCGPAAYHFVDWLAAGGQTLWQILPLGGIGLGNSPYMSSSAFAGNVLLIDLAELQRRGWLDADDLAPVPGLRDDRIDFPLTIAYRMERLARAARRFAAQANEGERADLARFAEQHAGWLPDYTLFMSLAEHHQGRDWCDWPAPLAHREPQAMAQARREHAERMDFWAFCQWCFFRQWHALRAYANQRGVRIVGDVPIFIAYQSAEVWAHRELFELDADGQRTVVAGVPPDYFAATGQRWGNPLYRWRVHAQDGYAWWVNRLRCVLDLVDIVRIDHFRGFAAHWEIPASEPTAMVGRWVEGPGAALFDAFVAAFGSLPIIAEDLGIITPDVEALRTRYGLPGMRILQFAWGRDGALRYLPHQHDHDCVVYTGSHDNNTTIGWWAETSDDVRHHVREYLAVDGHDIAWDLIRAVSASVADQVVHPMQDVLSLGPEHRMNIPGVGEGCWGWRFHWGQVSAEPARRLMHLTGLYGRLASQRA